MRAELAPGKKGDQEFTKELGLYLESHDDTKDTLEPALFRYSSVTAPTPTTSRTCFRGGNSHPREGMDNSKSERKKHHDMDH
jgi:hypothetical protein